jgi:hypothetical protein
MSYRPVHTLQQQVVPQPYQRPVFTQNPLKYLINNNYSGSLHINNLHHMNKLYDMMKEALLNDGSGHVMQPVAPGQIFTTTNTNKPRVFMAVKGQKIFNIIKENNPVRKSVKIIYNEDDNEEYEYEDEVFDEEKEGHYEEGHYEPDEEEEHEEVEGQQREDIFNTGHIGWDNYTSFK